MDKAALRRRYRSLRESLSPSQVAEASRAVCRHLAEWPPLAQAHTVMAYLAFRNEIDLSPLFDAFPDKRWVLPRIAREPSPHLVLHPYDPRRLVRHPFGMLEPDPALPTVSPEEVELVLVPGIAFDRRGYRLGFGGGYYDRFLPTTPALRVGVTYDELLVERLPVEAWDSRVDWLVTPGGLYEVRSGEG